MAIYNISELYEKKKHSEDTEKEQQLKKDRFFSTLAARLFFLLLLIADITWGIYSLLKLAVCGLFFLFSFGKFKDKCMRSLLACRRALVCAIALSIAIFSPALGIMFSCIYFLMYDKEGVEEIVPSSLQEQFKEFMTP